MKNILALIFILALSISVNAQKVLFLDAGHGGKDPGAISATGVPESQINNDFVNEIKVEAEAKGFKVIVVSSLTEYVPLTERIKKVNNYELKKGETAQFVSIHAGASDDPTISGSKVFVMRSEERSEGSMELAKKMAGILGVTVKEKGLTVLREAKIPAILIEVGYMSNQEDLNNMMTPDMRTVLVKKIVSVL